MTGRLKRMREDAKDIFQAGLAAVAPGAAVKKFCTRQGGCFRVDGQEYDLDDFERVVVLGAGKAGAAMAKAVATAASIALPPFFIISTPTSEAIFEDEATTPLLPRTGCRLVLALAIVPTRNSVVMTVMKKFRMRLFWFTINYSWNYRGGKGW